MIPQGLQQDMEELLDALVLSAEATDTTRKILTEMLSKAMKYGEAKGLKRSLEILDEVER